MTSERVDKAVACYKSGFSCSQAVFSTYAEFLGLDPVSALKISGTFGGGMAGTGGTCGAVTGAIMAIGLKYGKIRPEDEDVKKKAYAISHEFMKKFKTRHSSIICKELVGCDISTPEGMQEFKDRACNKTLCPGFVGSAAEILEEIL